MHTLLFNIEYHSILKLILFFSFRLFVLLFSASDDLPNTNKIRHLLEDIESIREKKIQDWQNEIKKNESVLEV